MTDYNAVVQSVTEITNKKYRYKNLGRRFVVSNAIYYVFNAEIKNIEGIGSINNNLIELIAYEDDV